MTASAAKSKAVEMDTGEETVRLLALLIRQRSASQNEAIVEMGRAGFQPKRIASLLGTSPATVSDALKRARQKGKSSSGGS
jgi:DNA-directed RNA polymerase specialized sigma24 family protein